MIAFNFFGPSGAGKSVIQHSLPIDFLTNYTTRGLRSDEVEGKHIIPVDHAQFLRLVEEGRVFEWTEYAGNYYGTPMDAINNLLKGKPYHSTKDIVGVQAMTEKLGRERVVNIFVKPPSIDELVRRMKNRGDSKEKIEQRIAYLYETNELDNEQYADYIIYNQDLDTAILEAHKIVIVELAKACEKSLTFSKSVL